MKGWENVQDIARVPKSKSRDKHIQEIKVRAKSCRHSGKKIFHLYDGQCISEVYIGFTDHGNVVNMIESIF